MIKQKAPPNPFAPDQLAWMRVYQQAGFPKAYRGSDGHCYIEGNVKIPSMGVFPTLFVPKEISFIHDVLPMVGEEIYFADYAPLDNETVIS